MQPPWGKLVPLLRPVEGESFGQLQSQILAELKSVFRSPRDSLMPFFEWKLTVPVFCSFPPASEPDRVELNGLQATASVYVLQE
jgi:hypothetical protein